MARGYKSTRKQWAYFRSLTGDSLPSGCSMSEASRLIDKAKRGEYVRPADKVTVTAWRFTGLAAECLTEEMKAVKYAVYRNYQQERSGFESLEAAELWARAMFPNAEIEVSRTVRGQYMD
jgi:hypothetical protein